MRRAARLLPVLLASAPIAVGAGGCGDTGTRVPSSSTTAGAATETGPITTRTIPPGQSVRGDGDVDNPRDLDGNGDRDRTSTGIGHDGDSDGPLPASYRFPDADDRATFNYGRRPSAAEGRAVAGVLARYYAAASSGDGATTCSLLRPSLARSLPEGYAGTVGPDYMRGVAKTCAAVLTRTIPARRFMRH